MSSSSSVSSASAAEEHEERERLECEEARAKAKRDALYNAWKKWGKALYSHKWQYLSPSSVKEYIKMVHNTLTAPKFVNSKTSGGISHISHISKDAAKVARVKACKYLHLRSTHNALATEIEEHISVKYNSKMVQVCHSYTYKQEVNKKYCLRK